MTRKALSKPKKVARSQKSKELVVHYTNSQGNFSLIISVNLFKKITNAKEYVHAEKMLDRLMDVVREDENHPLAMAMQIIGDNLEEYDDKHFPLIGENVSEIEMVKYLMESNKLHQKDLATIFGSQSNVSKFLNGKRKLSKSQIIALKEQFGISADFFVR